MRQRRPQRCLYSLKLPCFDMADPPLNKLAIRNVYTLDEITRFQNCLSV